MLPFTAPGLFGVLIYPDVEPIDIGGTAGVLSMASRVLPNLRYTTIARDAGPVRLSGGLIVQAEHGFATAPPCDVVIVCGGPGWLGAAADTALVAYLRGLEPTGVASVCTGALILAASGLLDGRAATTRRHAAGQEAIAPLSRLAQGTNIRPAEAAVVDDGVVTSGGVSLAIDATLYLLGRRYGHDAAVRVAALIEYDRAYAANRAALGHMIATPGRRDEIEPVRDFFSCH
jgi:transcriptional regulator GlxA family with amidase domain